jgi:hypothetical protein
MEERVFKPRHSPLYWLMSATSLTYVFIDITFIIQQKFGTEWFFFWVILTCWCTVNFIRDITSLLILRSITFSNDIQFEYFGKKRIVHQLSDPVRMDGLVVSFKDCTINLDNFVNMKDLSVIINDYSAKGYLNLVMVPKKKEKPKWYKVFLEIGLFLVLFGVPVGTYFILNAASMYVIGPATDALVLFFLMVFSVFLIVKMRNKHKDKEQQGVC